MDHPIRRERWAARRVAVVGLALTSANLTTKQFFSEMTLRYAFKGLVPKLLQARMTKASMTELSLQPVIHRSQWECQHLA